MIRKRCLVRRCSALLVAALALGTAQPVLAQGFFERLFGGFRHEPSPQRSNAYADPQGSPERGETSGSHGRGTVFCVRTCDGRYFPLQHHAGATPAEVCHALCPAAKTMVFSGSRIDGAVAPNGARYADLDHAFAYRDKTVPNCTCNGRDGLGLARIEATTDPTLRPGDIVATRDGLATFNGRRDSAAFTPINRSSGEWARRLSEIKVRPAPQHAPVDVTASISDREKPKPRTERLSRY